MIKLISIIVTSIIVILIFASINFLEISHPYFYYSGLAIIGIISFVPIVLKEENEFGAMFERYFDSSKSTLVISFSIIIFLVLVIFTMYSFHGIEKNSNPSFYIPLFVGVFGIFISILSLINTIWLLRYNETRITSYDHLLSVLNSELKVLKTYLKNYDISENKGLPYISILSPSPAIGNISADTSLYDKFSQNISNNEIRNKISPVVLTNANFSEWHKFFIEQRMNVIKDFISGDSLKKAKSRLKKEFPKEWFNNLRHDKRHYKPDMLIKVKQLITSLFEDIKYLEKNKVVDIKLNKENIFNKIAILGDFAHRAADIQAQFVLEGWIDHDKIILINSPDINYFPPCIAIRIHNSNFMCWMAPQQDNGVRNDLMGYYSKETSAKIVIQNLIDHYENVVPSMEGVEVEKIKYFSFTNRLNDFIKSKPTDVLIKKLNKMNEELKSLSRENIDEK